MGAGHAHAGHGSAAGVAPGRIAAWLLLGSLAVVAVGTAVGLVLLWPDGAKVSELSGSNQYAAPGVTFPHADVVSVQPVCGSSSASGKSDPSNAYRTSARCGHADVRVQAGTRPVVTVALPPEVLRAGLAEGDTVQLVRTPGSAGAPAGYTYFSTDRTVPIFWFAALFVVLVIAVARWRGAMALVAMAFGAFVVTRFMLPALLVGESGPWVALSGSAAIMFVVLYLTHGPSMRTSAALGGTLLGLGATAAIGTFAVSATQLTGVADETGALLASVGNPLNFPGLLTCGLIVAGLGVLNDVTITQASAVWELRAAAPHLPRRQVFTSAMRIGRDHIASTIYTIVFAYAGGSLVVLLLLTIYDRPLLDLISSEDIAEEIVRTLSSAIGLVLAVPLTTALAAAVASPAKAGTPQRGRRRRVD